MQLATRALYVLLLTSASTPVLAQALHEVRISNFRQGLIKQPVDADEDIYLEGNSFPLVANGRCVANGHDYPCMWHGFEFKFESHDDLSILNCSTVMDPPGAMSNPEKSFGTNVSIFNWNIELHGYSGRFVNPQYQVALKPHSFTKQKASTECKYAGATVLKFDFTIVPSTEPVSY